ncbi:Spherulation-specific family 4 [Nemania sp. FL0916]|nr:Spherulation-specific family 4 [Nemania sp. FL0916]
MMRTTALLISLAVRAASATGILLPLYVYPSETYNDHAALWTPAFNAISSQPSVDWLVVVNVDSGPGGSSPGNNDINYIYGTAQLNSYSNVRTVGYVHTEYGAADMSTLRSNITDWANWASYTASDIAVGGIFFDESGTDSYDYLNEAISYAKSAFGNDNIISVCNFGTTAAAEFYDICTVVVAFEDTAANYGGQSTLNSNIPSGYADQAAIIVNEFHGSLATLQSDIQTLKNNGVGYGYFVTNGYDSITTPPADVSQLATDFA